MTRVGVISDTHSLLRKEAVSVLQGADLIIHAGDIGDESVIDDLKKIAPVRAIRGNIDKGEWADVFPDDDMIEIEGRYIYVIHNLREMELDPVAAGFAAVISGHSHQPRQEMVDDVLYLNPGSAGPRRFRLPVALAYMNISDDGIEAGIRELNI